MITLSNVAKGIPVLMAVHALAGVYLPPIPADLTTPVQQRLAITSPGAMSIAWNTYEQMKRPCVEYGHSPHALHFEECSESSVTYETSRTYSNVVTLTGLAPATTYYYKIVSTNSSIGEFFSPRSAGDKTPFGVSVVIDLGAYGPDGYDIPTSNSKRDSIQTIPTVQPELKNTTIGRLADNFDNYEFVVHPGDFAYADQWMGVPLNASDEVAAYESILEQFYDQLAPISGQKPYMVGPGNHDADCDEGDYEICPMGQTNFTDFIVRFGRTMPSAFPSKSSQLNARINAEKAKNLSKAPFWYSFEYGMVHFVMINTETDFANAPDGPGTSINAGPFGFPNQQLEFLKADLASVDRTVTPWLVVAGHRPWYSTGGNGLPASQEAFETILYTYGVDLALFGHVHNSQRFMPVYNNTADPNGMHDPKAPMYIVAGGSGNIEGLSSIGTNVSFNAFAYADDYSYATLNFLDHNNLKVDFIRSSTGEVLDSSVLYKSHKEQFVAQNVTAAIH
ncbi:Metallo-dependent phosphatase [Penicillium sp. IBT 16267x]|nr:Metallo-dependent phosphatase [Penicillium sp. IBT 16267x]